MASDLTARARDALAGVTDGPWSTCLVRGGEGVGIENADDEQLFIESFGLTYAVNSADARFIAEARTLVPEMLERIERLETVLATVRREAESAAATGWRDLSSESVDEAAGMQSVGELICRILQGPAGS